jgi:predicted TPR repeat methyltransferase
VTTFLAYARYYDLLYRDKPYSAEATYVTDLARRNGCTVDSLLELGVGTGGHAVHFLDVARRVDGVDLSADMLSAAEARRRALPPVTANRLSLHLGDVRDVRLGRRFSLVVSMFHVISYQCANEHVMEAFRTAREHLDRGGLFIFDLWHGPGVLSEPPVVRVRRFRDEETEVERIAEPFLRSRENIVDVNYSIRVTDRRSKAVDVIVEKHEMRYFFEPELLHMLSLASMEHVETVSWFSHEPPTVRDWTAAVVARAV